MDQSEIEARLRRIIESVARVRAKRPLSYEELVGDSDKYLATERDLQVAIEAAIDVGSDLLAKHSFRAAGGYREVFRLMGDAGILPRDFAARIAPMGGFRNVLVHVYLEVDSRKVYQIIQHDVDDLETFAQLVSAYIDRVGSD